MAFKLLQPKSKYLLGIDIGSSAVKVVGLEKSSEKLKLKSIGREVLPEDTIVDGAIMSKLPLAEGLNKIFAEQRIRNGKIATSISGHSVIVKKVALPMLSSSELEESIQWEAEQYIPFDLAEVNVDYQVLKEVPDEQKLEVILVAAKKEKIADYCSVVSMTGKSPKVVDIDAFALQNAYEYNYEPEEESIVALLNIGASSMTMNIVRGTEFLFTRDIATGGEQYTEFLQRDLGIDREEAEEYKQLNDVPFELEDQVRSVLKSVSENMALEIEKTFEYFKTTTYSEEIESLYICGGASKTEGLREYLSDTFQFPVEILDPFRRVEVNGASDILNDSEHSGADFAVAVGLAMRTEQDQ
jgi:type IV pilus assembly protein PilM